MNSLPGTAPAPSFDAPLDMLRACHGRIQAQCVTLQKLRAHLSQHGCDVQSQQAATAILRYFNTAGVHHHHDEEYDLFPLLLATSSSEARNLVTGLLTEHKSLEAAWRELRLYLVEVASGHSAKLDLTCTEHFINVYERHITLENAQLLPLSKQLLTPEQIAQLGRNMAARRMI